MERDRCGQSLQAWSKSGVFTPSFGNQQLLVIFAAVNCHLRYSVALTTGAVTCIYGAINAG